MIVGALTAWRDTPGFNTQCGGVARDQDSIPGKHPLYYR